MRVRQPSSCPAKLMQKPPRQPQGHLQWSPDLAFGLGPEFEHVMLGPEKRRAMLG